MPAVAKEIESINDRYAQAIGIASTQTAQYVISQWETVNRFSPAGRALLLANIAAYIMTRRSMTALLAVRRHQLVRALETGYQVPGPDYAETLQGLRDLYTQSLAGFQVMRPLRAKALNPNTRIPVDTDEEDVTPLVDGVNDDIEDEIKTTVEVLGDKRLGKLAKREGIVTPKDVETSRNMVASGSARIVMNGGRHTEAALAEKDTAVVIYVRKHNEHMKDEPCDFCKMLLSRTNYKGLGTAGTVDRKYHANCHCTGEAIYSMEDFLTNPRYARNIEAMKEWVPNELAYLQSKYRTAQVAV